MDDAEAAYTRFFQSAESMGDRLGSFQAQRHLADVAWRKGDLVLALERLERAMGALSRQLDRRVFTAPLALDYAALLAQAQRWAEAEQVLAQARALPCLPLYRGSTWIARAWVELARAGRARDGGDTHGCASWLQAVADRLSMLEALPPERIGAAPRRDLMRLRYRWEEGMREWGAETTPPP